MRARGAEYADPAFAQQYDPHQYHERIDDLVEALVRRAADEPQPDERSCHRQGQKGERYGDVLRRKLAEQPVRHDLQDVGPGEVDGTGADEYLVRQPLRQEVDLERRPARVRHEAGEARDRRPEGALHRRRLRDLAPAREPDKVEQPEGDGDQADGNADVGGREIRREPPARGDAHGGSRHHDLEIARVPALAIAPHRDRVADEQDRQQNARRIARRDDERQQRRRQRADAGEPAFGEAEEDQRDRGDCEEKRIGEQGIRRGWTGWSASQITRKGRARQPLAFAARRRTIPAAIGDGRWKRGPRAATRKFTSASCATREVSGASRLRRSTGSRSRKRYSIRRPASTGAGSWAACATPASTRSTAMSPPAAATRRRSSRTARSPAPSARSPIRTCSPR